MIDSTRYGTQFTVSPLILLIGRHVLIIPVLISIVLVIVILAAVSITVCALISRTIRILILCISLLLNRGTGLYRFLLLRFRLLRVHFRLHRTFRLLIYIPRIRHCRLLCSAIRTEFRSLRIS